MFSFSLATLRPAKNELSCLAVHDHLAEIAPMKKLLKTLYTHTPFKRELFLFLRYCWKPSPSLYKHLYFTGIFTVPVTPQVSFRIKHYGFLIENEIFWEGLNGGWEKVSLGLWIKLCQKADVVVDIGANTGVYSLVAKALNKNSVVYALEPVKRVFEKLCENNVLNHYDIHCLPIAASDSTGKAVIYDTADEHTYSVTVNKNLNPETEGLFVTEIETTTLDDLIEKEKLTKIYLIKIDVETHEVEVMRGFQRHIRHFKPTLLIEILTDEVGAKVQQLLEGLGYLYFNIHEVNGVKQVEHITKSNYYNYLICTPAVASDLGLILNTTA
jgi:FkbM family methyltransferase